MKKTMEELKLELKSLDITIESLHDEREAVLEQLVGIGIESFKPGDYVVGMANMYGIERGKEYIFDEHNEVLFLRSLEKDGTLAKGVFPISIESQKMIACLCKIEE